jgi:hypothetical protein
MTWAAIGATVVTTAVGAATASGGASAAGRAAGLQQEYLDLGINELRNALGPSMTRLDQAQAWSDAQLRKQYQGAMGETLPYANTGLQGMSQLNYLMGMDPGAGPQPTAPTAPKPPKYSKDPATAAAQRKAYEKAQRIYDREKAQYDIDSKIYSDRTAAAASDPNYGRMMKPYDDQYEGRIDEVAGRQYDNKFAQGILDTANERYDDKYNQGILDTANERYNDKYNKDILSTAGEKYNDKYAKAILGTAGEKYNDKYNQEVLDTARDSFGAEDFEADPGYQFRRSEGNRGIEQGAAARGSLLSGAALKELDRFNQDTASNEFDRAHSRWADQRDTHLQGVEGQQAFDYGAWDANKNARLGTLIGEQAFDYGAFSDDKMARLGTLVGQQGFDYGVFDNSQKTRLGTLVGQQDFDYGNFTDSQNTRLAAQSGQQAMDYGIWGDQKNTELNTLQNNRNFDYGSFTGNRDFQYNALNNMVGIGQNATDDRTQIREYFGGQRTGNAINNATQQGNWQQAMAANMAELLSQSGNAQAAGQVGAANAYSNAFQAGGNMLAYYYGGNNRRAGGIGGGNTLGGPGTDKPFLTVTG